MSSHHRLLEQFLETQPIASQFFQQALKTQCLAHAYVLKGRQVSETYSMALAIAQCLNCQNPVSATQPCGICHSCQWIAKNQHPAVSTISRLTYLVGDQGKDLSLNELKAMAKKTSQPTQIKTEQIHRLINQLALASQDYRVVIFCDAEEKGAEFVSPTIAPADWQMANEGLDKTLHLRPLGPRHFNAASANRFLKTLEEPPAKTLFFFLTDAVENLLDTIVSRCQVVPFRSGLSDFKGNLELSDTFEGSTFKQIMGLLEQHRPDYYPALNQFEDTLIKEQGLTYPQALNYFQAWLQTQYADKLTNPKQFQRYRQIQTAINQAQQHLKAHVNTPATLNSLLMAFTES